MTATSREFTRRLALVNTCNASGQCSERLARGECGVLDDSFIVEVELGPWIWKKDAIETAIKQS